jgi:hypothetical protein
MRKDLHVKRYKSEIGPELSISLSVLMSMISILIISKGSWGGFVVLIIVGGFLLHLFLTTYYEVSGDQLRIKSGFVIDKKIPIRSITKIESTRTLLSAPALSLNRLLLKYNRYDQIIISPQYRMSFIAELLNISEHIEVQIAEVSNQ